MDREESRKSKKRIGRNDPCPCGSGKKYKHCCLGADLKKVPPTDINSEDFSKKIWKKHQEYRVKEKVRTQMFGKVRPIIHTNLKGYKMVAVGNQLHYSKSWKTFPDFLFSYIIHILGSDWGNQELKKPYDERHQILKWYDGVCRFQGKQEKGENGVYSAIPDGFTAAYLRLAYDLYILRHHTALQNEVVKRLKNKDQRE